MLYEIYKSKQLKFRPILASKLLFLKANVRKTMKIKSMLTFKVVRCHCRFSFSFYKLSFLSSLNVYFHQRWLRRQAQAHTEAQGA